MSLDLGVFLLALFFSYLCLSSGGFFSFTLTLPFLVFVGSNLSEELLKKDFDVVVVDNPVISRI